MNILIIGSGARENALAWKISQSHHVSNIFIAPGNAGCTRYGKTIQIDISNFEEIKNLIINNNIEIVVGGNEEPLVKGLKDYIYADNNLKNIHFVGPFKDGALLEGSKDFAKQFMLKYNIPTAPYATFSVNNIDKTIDFLNSFPPPYVIKADGLAAGKGVTIVNNITDALIEINDILIKRKFGNAGNKIVIEQFLKGIELSAFIITDGKNYKILPYAKDYKKIGENDQGPNTGGMGAISPVPFLTKNIEKQIEEKIIRPTIYGLQQENIDYRGFIFFGLMIVENSPYVIEYNCRLGDPETEAILPLINNDIVEMFLSLKNQSLNNINISINPAYSATIILASKGYPENYEKGKPITGIDNISDSIIFHAGTKLDNGKLLSNGGRVIAITSIDNTLQNALNKSYTNAQKIQFENKYYRQDIGKDLLQYL